MDEFLEDFLGLLFVLISAGFFFSPFIISYFTGNWWFMSLFLISWIPGIGTIILGSAILE